MRKYWNNRSVLIKFDSGAYFGKSSLKLILDINNSSYLFFSYLVMLQIINYQY